MHRVKCMCWICISRLLFETIFSRFFGVDNTNTHTCSTSRPYKHLNLVDALLFILFAAFAGYILEETLSACLYYTQQKVIFSTFSSIWARLRCFRIHCDDYTENLPNIRRARGPYHLNMLHQKLFACYPNKFNQFFNGAFLTLFLLHLRLHPLVVACTESMPCFCPCKHKPTRNESCYSLWPKRRILQNVILIAYTEWNYHFHSSSHTHSLVNQAGWMFRIWSTKMWCNRKCCLWSLQSDQQWSLFACFAPIRSNWSKMHANSIRRENHLFRQLDKRLQPENKASQVSHHDFMKQQFSIGYWRHFIVASRNTFIYRSHTATPCAASADKRHFSNLK